MHRKWPHSSRTFTMSDHYTTTQAFFVFRNQTILHFWELYDCQRAPVTPLQRGPIAKRRHQRCAFNIYQKWLCTKPNCCVFMDSSGTAEFCLELSSDIPWSKYPPFASQTQHIFPNSVQGQFTIFMRLLGGFGFYSFDIGLCRLSSKTWCTPICLRRCWRLFAQESTRSFLGQFNTSG